MVKRAQLIACLIWAVASSATAQPLHAQPARIVSTSPSITEMLFALGLGEQTVGVTSYCRYPPAARLKPKVGDYLNPNLEVILALKPDLVIVEKSFLRRSLTLAGLRLKLLEIDNTSLDGILQSMLAVGRAAGVESKAMELKARIVAELQELEKRTAQLKRPKVLIIVGREPGRLDGLVCAGAGSYLDALIRLAGGTNALGATMAPYPKVNLEEVLARNPEVIVDLGDMSSPHPVQPSEQQEAVRLWKRYPQIAAARSGRVYMVRDDIYVVPGPRIAEAARRLARLIHPEARL